MAQTKEQRLAQIHADALSEFDKIQQAMRNERMQCLSDRRFYSIAGAQWEGPLGDQFENKPRLEFNKVHLAVIRIINEYRNNTVTVNFEPKDGSTNAEFADVCAGLYRADERESGAQEAYDNAFEEAVGGGFGAWRVRACYEDEDDEDNDKQRIALEPIFDADSSVYFNLDAKRQDKSDAKRCFVLYSMSHEAFEDEFGHCPSTWPKSVHQYEFDWCTPDVVYVCEFYRIEETSSLVHIFRSLDGEEITVSDDELQEDEERLSVLEATGHREVRQKRIKTKRVHKYILSGAKTERDEGYIAGSNIPIIPVFGKRWFVDNIERCMGHVRLAKDAQRLENSLLSWMTDMATRFDTEKPIVTPAQMQGWAHMWANDNVERFPYLFLNPEKDADGNPIPGTSVPMAYTKAPNIPPAMAALIQIANQALEDLLGNQEAGEQMQPNLSGRAVELIQNRLDMQTFIYVSNFSKAMKRCGEVWLSMKKDVTREQERKMKVVASDGTVSSATLKRPIIDQDTGEQIMENDLDDATFDVWPDVGPSSSSKRASTVRALTGMASITEDPNDKSVLTAAAMMNMEGEGLSDVRDYYRSKLVKMGVVKPTDEEQAEMQAQAQAQANQPPDPQSQYLIAAADEATAAAAQKRADTVDTIAAADLKRAQTAKTYSDAHVALRNQQLASLQALQEALAGHGFTGLDSSQAVRSPTLQPQDPARSFNVLQ